MLAKIEQDGYVAHYDPCKQIVCVVIFSQSLPSQFVETVYQWINDLHDANHDVHAILMDLTRLRMFPKPEDSVRDEAIIGQFPALASLPTVQIVANAFQERKLGSYFQAISLLSNQQIVHDFIAAFDYIEGFYSSRNTDHGLSTKRVSSWLDTDTNFIHVIYYGVINAQATVDAYKQLFSNFEAVGVENVKAGLFEFRYVSKFDNSNLQSVKRSSGTINKSYDMNHIAVPLIVGNFHQEQMVRLALKISSQEDRKKIVFSLDEAFQFIGDFHKKRNALITLSDKVATDI